VVHLYYKSKEELTNYGIENWEGGKHIPIFWGRVDFD